MKASLLFLAILATVGSVNADIPMKGQDVKTYVYGGDQAAQKYASINSPVIPGNSSGWSGEAQDYKVERSADGLMQTVCTRNYNYRNKIAPSFNCVATKSLNGKPVPVFVPPPRRLG